MQTESRSSALRISALETIRLDEFPNVLWVRVHTDSGLIGLGETFYGAQAVEAHIHETLAERLLGQDALRIEALNRAMTALRWRIPAPGSSTAPPRQLISRCGICSASIAICRCTRCWRPVLRSAAHLQHLCRLSIRASGDFRATANWQPTATGPYEDLDAFMHRADEQPRACWRAVSRR